MNRDCRQNTNVLGVGNGTCDYGNVCTFGVGNGQGNKSCYNPGDIGPIKPRNVGPVEPIKPRTISPVEPRTISPVGPVEPRNVEPFIGINNTEGVNVTLWVNIVLIVLIILIIYKVYNKRI